MRSRAPTWGQGHQHNTGGTSMGARASTWVWRHQHRVGGNNMRSRALTQGWRHRGKVEGISMTSGAPTRDYGQQHEVGAPPSLPPITLSCPPTPLIPQHPQISQKRGRAWRKGFNAQWASGRRSGDRGGAGCPSPGRGDHRRTGRGLRSIFGGRWRVRPRRTRVC